MERVEEGFMKSVSIHLSPYELYPKRGKNLLQVGGSLYLYPHKMKGAEEVLKGVQGPIGGFFSSWWGHVRRDL